MGKKVYLQTLGCQMNVYDSERLSALLLSQGHQMTENAEDADIIVLNTCSVRNKAETRALGRLSEFQRFKQKNPHIKLVVTGCMAQRMGTDLAESMPYLDLVLGPDQIFKLPAILQNHSDSRQIAVCSSREDFDSQKIWEQEVLPSRKTPFTSFVAISRGCDNFCSYCIVPYVRGPERHRPIDQIIREVQLLAESGCKEVTLIGQNVNSYTYQDKDFADLLQMVSEETQIEWIRFMTSHPKDMSDKLIDKIASLSKLCEHIHFPLQAGSDRILKKMNRGYSSQKYLELVKRIKKEIENVSLTTDIICGFPSENREEFERTLEVMKEVEFDSAFMFHYSTREGTKADSFVDDVPEEEKLNRLYATIKLQKEISNRKNQKLVGKTMEVLVDETSKRDENKWKRKTKNNKTVIINTKEDLLGRIVTVRINQADSFTLFAGQ
jgi:tRNA-2-methylthio-N6-dimethylallyladenosine synthase